MSKEFQEKFTKFTNKISAGDVTTLKGAYLGVEVKEGFDSFELGDTGVEIKIQPRTGFGQYTNFSGLLKIISSHPENKYNVGDYVWCPAKSVVRKETKFSGSIFGENHPDVFAFGDNNILFKGKDITEVEGDSWVLTQNTKAHVEQKGSVYIFNDEDETKREVIAGPFPKGSFVTSLTGNRVELWQKEVQYWAIHIDRITSVNGKPYGGYYKIDLFENFEFERNGLVLKGAEAAKEFYQVEPTMKSDKLVKLSNPKLPMDGKVAIVRQPKKVPYAHEDNIIYVVNP